ncbi:MAG: PQQ-like beta-propeller repeat protein, partial [Phycisphaerales bacterium]|nr:PQQ-like beta-propeller repeat protein [Phycisphaerales bacterium]
MARPTDLVFTGFNSRVIAVNRDTGDVEWTWRSPKGRGYVTMMLDGDRLIVSVNGYLYCLDPRTGEMIWQNPLDGFGLGIAALVSENARGDGAAMA